MELTTKKYTNLHRSRHHNHIALHNGQVFIYDNSGANPDETDDGPLNVIQEELITIRCHADGKFGPYANIPVTDKAGSGKRFTAMIDLEGAIKLGRRLGCLVTLVTTIYNPVTD